MNFGKTLATATAATAFLALSAGSALALSAHATGNVNVRTGPSVSYNKVDTLHTGENVEVKQCQNGWCYVEHSGPDGWVSANYLSRNSYSNNNSGNYSGGNSDPDNRFSYGFGSNGTHFGFSFGNPPQNWPRPQTQPKASYYSGTNYTGYSFCVNSGQSVGFVGQIWNDKISSVRVFNGASTTMCQHANYGGFCRTTSRNEPALGPWLNDQISAIRVN